jgi:hypothetical protein
VKILLLAGLCCMAAAPVLASETDFVYDDHGKRDPFVPMITSTGSIITDDADLSVDDLSLEGVVLDPKGNSVAVINGKIVKVGDSIGAFQIANIENDQVAVRRAEESFMLKIKKGGM